MNQQAGMATERNPRELESIISRLTSLITDNKSNADRIFQLGHRLSPIPPQPLPGVIPGQDTKAANSGGFIEELNLYINSLYQLCRDMEQEINRIENLA